MTEHAGKVPAIESLGERFGYGSAFFLRPCQVYIQEASRYGYWAETYRIELVIWYLRMILEAIIPSQRIQQPAKCFMQLSKCATHVFRLLSRYLLETSILA